MLWELAGQVAGWHHVARNGALIGIAAIAAIALAIRSEAIKNAMTLASSRQLS